MIGKYEALLKKKKGRNTATRNSFLSTQGVYKETIKNNHPKLHKSKKSNKEGITRPHKAIIQLKRERTNMRFNSMVELSSPSKVQLFHSPHIFHIIQCGMAPKIDAALRHPNMPTC